MDRCLNSLDVAISFSAYSSVEFTIFWRNYVTITLREKCANTVFFLVCIYPYLDWIRRNTDLKNSIFGHFSRSGNSFKKSNGQVLCCITCVSPGFSENSNNYWSFGVSSHTKLESTSFLELLFFPFIWFCLRLRPATLLKKTLWHWCFPVNFEKFLITASVTEHIQWLLLDLEKIVKFIF